MSRSVPSARASSSFTVVREDGRVGRIGRRSSWRATGSARSRWRTVAVETRGTPAISVDIDLDATESLLIWMRESGHDQLGKVGLFGTSRGAEHALLVTSLMVRERKQGSPGCGRGPRARPIRLSRRIQSPTKFGAERRSSCLLGLASSPHGGGAVRSDTLASARSPIEIERYDGPVVHQSRRSTTASGPSAARRRLAESRLRAAGRAPEVHIYKGEGHHLRPETERMHYLRVVDFFGRALIDGSL